MVCIFDPRDHKNKKGTTSKIEHFQDPGTLVDSCSEAEQPYGRVAALCPVMGIVVKTESGGDGPSCLSARANLSKRENSLRFEKSTEF